MKSSEPHIDSLIKYVAKEPTSNLFDVMIARQLALEMLSRSKEFRLISELENLSATGHRAVMEQAIGEAKARGDVNVETVKSLLDVKVKEIRGKPSISYDVVIPLSFNLFAVPWLPNDLRVSVQGNEIALGYLGNLAPESLSKIPTFLGKPSSSAATIAAASLRIQARDPYFAVQHAWPHANTLASMMEFCLSWQRPMKFPPMPIGGVRPQNCAVVNENKKLVDTYGTLDLVEDAPLGLGLQFSKIWGEVKALESRLRQSGKVAPKNVMSIIIEALRIYGAAANELDPNFAVLRLWIGLEKMMGLGQDMRAGDVGSRLKTAFRHKPEVWDDEIERLEEQRNRMVHRGVMEATPEDAYFAKILYGFTVGLLLEYSSKFSQVESIVTSLNLGNREPDTLSEVRAAVDHLLLT